MNICNPQPFLAMPYAPGTLQWLDAWTRTTEQCLEWERTLWQPLLDAQAEWLRQWSAFAAWPLSQAVVVRGGEELA